MNGAMTPEAPARLLLRTQMPSVVVGWARQKMRARRFDWGAQVLLDVAVLAGVDSARDRRAMQATLPHWAANAWIQTGDLGVSDHHYRNGACIACLYLPTGKTPNRDELVAAALQVPDQ